MDVRLIESRHILNSKGEAGVVWLTQNVINKGLLGEIIHDPRRKVALETSRRWDIDLETRISEGTSRDTPTTSATGDVERILVRRCFHVGSISPESICGIKDGCLVDGSAVVVGR